MRTLWPVPPRFTNALPPRTNHVTGAVLLLQEHGRMAGSPDDGEGTAIHRRNSMGKNMKLAECERTCRDQQAFAFGWSREWIKGSGEK